MEGLLSALFSPEGSLKWFHRTELCGEGLDVVLRDPRMPELVPLLSTPQSRAIFLLERLAAAAAGPGCGSCRPVSATGEVLDPVPLAEFLSRRGDSGTMVRNLPCPVEWRLEIEGALSAHRLESVSSAREFDMAAELPRGPFSSSGSGPLVTVAAADSGMPQSIDTCVKQFLMLGEGSGMEDAANCCLWVCCPVSGAPQALLCEALLSLSPAAGFEGFLRGLQHLSRRKLPFTVYVGVQRVGDLIVLPPDTLYCFCVAGPLGRPSAKCVEVAWERHTPFTLEHTYLRSQPRWRALRVPEKHKTRAMAFYGLKKRSDTVLRARKMSLTHLSELPPLIRVVDSMLREERIAGEESEGFQGKFQLYSDSVPHGHVCCVCHSAIFNRAYRCLACPGRGAGRGADVCLNCVAEGVGCGERSHLAHLSLMEAIPLSECRQVLHAGILAFKEAVSFFKEDLCIALKQALLPEPKDVKSVATVAALQVSRASEGAERTCQGCSSAVPLCETATCASCANSFCVACLLEKHGTRVTDCLRRDGWRCPSCTSPVKVERDRIPDDYPLLPSFAGTITSPPPPPPPPPPPIQPPMVTHVVTPPPPPPIKPPLAQAPGRSASPPAPKSRQPGAPPHSLPPAVTKSFPQYQRFPMPPQPSRPHQRSRASSSESSSSESSSASSSPRSSRHGSTGGNDNFVAGKKRRRGTHGGERGNGSPSKRPALSRLYPPQMMVMPPQPPPGFGLPGPGNPLFARGPWQQPLPGLPRTGWSGPPLPGAPHLSSGRLSVLAPGGLPMWDARRMPPGPGRSGWRPGAGGFFPPPPPPVPPQRLGPPPGVGIAMIRQPFPHPPPSMMLPESSASLPPPPHHPQRANTMPAAGGRPLPPPPPPPMMHPGLRQHKTAEDIVIYDGGMQVPSTFKRKVAEQVTQELAAFVSTGRLDRKEYMDMARRVVTEVVKKEASHELRDNTRESVARICAASMAAWELDKASRRPPQ